MCKECIDKMEYLSRDEMSIIQGERLKKVVKKVYDNVAIYRKKMDIAGVKPSDIHTISDITKLPFTVKYDLRESYPFDFFSVPKSEIVRVHASSGTTGKLTVVGYTMADIDMWADMVARCMRMIGCDKNSVLQDSFGYGLFTGGLGMHYGSEKLGAMTVPISSGNTLRQLQLMRDFKADTICCTPSYAIFLSESMAKEGFNNRSEFNLKRGIMGAEPWSEEMRLDIERRMQIKAYDIYGLSEIMGPGVACECEEQDGLHFNEDHFYPEIVDPDTLEPVPFGQNGELVITTLTKEGIPLIRYRTRDITSFKTEQCKCGRTLIKINRIFGRSDDMLIIRGVNVFPSQIESVLLNIGDRVTPHYQILIDRVGAMDTFEIQVEMGETLVGDNISAIQSLMKEIDHEMTSNLGISAKIKLVNPNTISRSEGKAKRIVDLRNIKK